MPKLKEDEWEKILNNISIISFLQGLNIGGKIYNGYSIITNTKNQEVVSEDSIYITTSDNYYHKPTEKNLTLDSNSKGILNIDFERKSIPTASITNYYYPQEEYASYSSIINQTNVDDTDNIYKYLTTDDKKKEIAKKYFTALGRERYGMYRIKNNSEDLKKQFYKQ